MHYKMLNNSKFYNAYLNGICESNKRREESQRQVRIEHARQIEADRVAMLEDDTQEVGTVARFYLRTD